MRIPVRRQMACGVLLGPICHKWKKIHHSSFIIHHSIAGFTLIELLIVLSIIGLLAAFGLVGFANFNRGQSLKLAAQEMKANLRLAQNSALSGAAVSVGCSDVARQGGLFKGYQAVFDQNSKSYSVIEKCGSQTGSGIIDGVIRTYTLPNVDDIAIAQLSPSAPASQTCSANLCILFKPVNQGMDFVPALPDGSDAATITLKGKTSGDYRVLITKNGDIYETK